MKPLSERISEKTGRVVIAGASMAAAVIGVYCIEKFDVRNTLRVLPIAAGCIAASKVWKYLARNEQKTQEVIEPHR